MIRNNVDEMIINLEVKRRKQRSPAAQRKECAAKSRWKGWKTMAKENI